MGEEGFDGLQHREVDVGPFGASAWRAVPVALADEVIGLINALGNLGGFVDPSVGGFLQDVSGGSFLSTAQD